MHPTRMEKTRMDEAITTGRSEDRAPSGLTATGSRNPTVHEIDEALPPAAGLVEPSATEDVDTPPSGLRGIYIVLWSFIGAGVGYLVLSPVSMALFHLSHAGLEPHVFASMQDSVLGAMGAALSPSLRAWWLGFIGLGTCLGAGVGLLVTSFARKEARLRAHASELSCLNGRLNEAYGQLVQADKLATLGLLAGTIIHDINNHLQLMKTVAEDELELLPVEARLESGWGEIEGHLQNIAALSDTARAFSRKTSGRRRSVDLLDCVKTAALLMGKTIKRKGVHYEERTEVADHVRVVGNKNELIQVFINLMQNAIDAMAADGVLTVGVEVCDGRVVASATDTGSGIPAPIRSRIFEAFFTTKPAELGTGLGLSICRRIVEHHDGEIEVDSQVGRGTTFRISLPLAA